MSTRTDLTITSTNHNDASKKVTNKVNYVNPNITNQQAVTLANMFADLTKDTYQSTTRTDTTDCDTIITRPMSLTYGGGSTNYGNVPADGICNITTNANMKTISFYATTTLDTAPQILNFIDNAQDFTIGLTDATWGGDYGWNSGKNKWTINFSKNIDPANKVQITPRTITFTLHFDATTQYNAYDKDITINVTAEE